MGAPDKIESAVYNGRRSYDSKIGYHLTEDGSRIITDDKGKTWRYAKEGDPSHFMKYHKRFVPIVSTAQKMNELQQEHGRVKAEKIMREQEPHHF